MKFGNVHRALVDLCFSARQRSEDSVLLLLGDEKIRGNLSAYISSHVLESMMYFDLVVLCLCCL